MKPKLLLGLALVLSGGVLFTGCSSPAQRQHAELSWPEKAEGLPWPQPVESAKIIQERFNHASKVALGSESDIAAIDKTIAAYQPRQRLHVTDLRWLSPTVTMAEVRAMEAGYIYIVEKKEGQWVVLTYYLKWIS
jgi:hypothetical protein